MNNTTVRELIQLLSKMNQDAVVCGILNEDEIFDDEPLYSSFEILREIKKATYINNNGDEIIGDIVVLI